MLLDHPSSDHPSSDRPFSGRPMSDRPTSTPGDPDVDLDVEHVRLRNLLRRGDGYVLQAAVGGLRGSTHVDLSFRPDQHPAIAADVDRILERLRSWCEDGTVLRLVTAPGKYFTLHAPDGTVLALPRRD